MIQIVCPYNSERFRYILDLIFKELLGISYSVVQETKEDMPSLEYSNQPGADIPDAGLLWQEEIVMQPGAHQIGNWDHIPAIFYTAGSQPLPFDLFSAVFYLVSRYEEYLPYIPDEHDRFPPEASILVQHHWIKLPLVNLWALHLKDLLLDKYPDLVFKPRKFEYRSTIDIDMAWKYRNKGFVRSTGAFFRDLSQGLFERMRERLSMRFKGMEDPYYNFDVQDQWHQTFDTYVTYFILLGEYGPFDKNIHPGNPAFVQLIQRLNQKYPVGIHPSYASHLRLDKVRNEIQQLQELCSADIQTSRQHFLRMKLPETYHLLRSLGIKEDHTLGYTSYSGFRAGIAADFYWFDLQKNETTDLRLIPFCHMDITPMHYEKRSISAACNDLTHFMKTIENCGGLFSSLWHNESLSDSERWKGWRKLYLHTLQTAQELVD